VTRKRLSALCLSAFASVCLLGGVATPAAASGLEDVKKLSQEAFAKLAKDLAAVAAIRALSPAVSLNLLGVDVSAEIGVANVASGEVWRNAGGGSTAVIIPRLNIYKAFSGGSDIGLSLGAAGSSGLTTLGVVGRYQLLAPATISPGVYVRFSGNRDIGSSTVDVRSLGLDLVVAKPIGFITPYIGAGGTRTDTKPLGSSLSAVSTSSGRLFAGFDTNLPFATLSAEAEKIGDVTTVSTKLGFKF
jgi:hypothetical protein